MRTSGAVAGTIFLPVTKKSSSRIRRFAGSRRTIRRNPSWSSTGIAECRIANFAGSAAVTSGGTAPSVAHGMYSQSCCSASAFPTSSSDAEPRSIRSVPMRPPAKPWMASARFTLSSVSAPALTSRTPSRGMCSLIIA